jgi:hypothetical protein
MIARRGDGWDSSDTGWNSGDLGPAAKILVSGDQASYSKGGCQ